METATTEAYVMLGLGLAVIAVRIALRIRTTGAERLCPDDYLMVGAAVSLRRRSLTISRILTNAEADPIHRRDVSRLER